MPLGDIATRIAGLHRHGVAPNQIRAVDPLRYVIGAFAALAQVLQETPCHLP
jgi:hypothetical protein